MTTESEPVRNSDLSCTFCGPGTWAMWELVTDDGVLFTCDRHHVEMSEAKIIRLERMKGEETWDKFPDIGEMFYKEGYVDDLKDFRVRQA